MFYRYIRLIALFFFKIFFRIKVYGTSNEPLEGKTIVCANHANNIDPILVSMAIKRQVHWMAKKELFDNVALAWFIKKLGVFPVSRGEADITAIKNALRILKDEKVLGIFPEGTRVKNIDLDSVKSGAGLLAVKSKANILPVYIDGNYKLFSKINIYIGDTLDLSDYYNKKLSPKEYEEVSRVILSTIYDLKSLEELN